MQQYLFFRLAAQSFSRWVRKRDEKVADLFEKVGDFRAKVGTFRRKLPLFFPPPAAGARAEGFANREDLLFGSAAGGGARFSRVCVPVRPQ